MWGWLDSGATRLVPTGSFTSGFIAGAVSGGVGELSGGLGKAGHVLLELEDRLAAHTRRVRRVLALPIPVKRLVEAREQLGPVHGGVLGGIERPAALGCELAERGDPGRNRVVAEAVRLREKPK